MSRRGVTIALSLSALVILLFVGRWGAALLSDRWWAELVSPEASRFCSNHEMPQPCAFFAVTMSFLPSPFTS